VLTHGQERLFRKVTSVSIHSFVEIIDHNPSWKENQRQKKESFWIRELQTLHPEGINKKA
jgi:hypothetical protein